MNHEDVNEIPDHLKSAIRRTLLEDIKGATTLDTYELELFEWYVNKTEALVGDMLASELSYIKEQADAGQEDVNDSGMVAAEYYLKRVRYSHVIYMTSLLEIFLERSCLTLTTIIGKQNLPFGVSELKGDQWSARRKFLQKYGRFAIPDELWSPIQTLIALRNNLVHENGSTSDLGPEKNNILSKCDGVSVDGHEVAIQADYVCSSLKSIRSLVRTN